MPAAHVSCHHAHPSAFSGLSAAARRSVIVALVACAFWPTAACHRLDCFDDGVLEQSYGDGASAAEEQNRIDFQQGVDDGLALTRADGENEGADEGYRDGYGEGYNSFWGYSSGYDDGYSVGLDDGYGDPSACSDGASAGAYDGDGAGYADGWGTSYDSGYDTGYSDGYQAAQDSCSATLYGRDSDANGPAKQPPDVGRATEVDPEDVQACFDRGYGDAFDISAYPRGLARGKLDNPDYQAGYNATYPAAYDSGVTAGESDGYADGYDAGYGDGYGFGYDQVYFGCYDDGYAGGYESGYAAGYDDGYGTGYDDGYSAGYDDGAADCA